MTITPRAAWVMLLASSAGALLLLLAVPNLGPAFRAARGDGVEGTFVARDLRCVQHPGHELCSWRGTFRPEEAGGTARTGVYLYGSGRGTLRTGQQVAALDTGRESRVYPPDGSREWIPTLGMALGGGLLFFPLARASVRVVRALRQPYDPDDPDEPYGPDHRDELDGRDEPAEPGQPGQPGEPGERSRVRS
jgi:hypothetical protein